MRAGYPFSIARRVFNVSLVCKSPSTPNCARQISLSPFDKLGGGGDITRFPPSSRKKTDDDGSVFSPILHTARAPKPVFLLSHQTKRADGHRIPGKHVAGLRRSSWMHFEGRKKIPWLWVATSPEGNSTEEKDSINKEGRRSEVSSRLIHPVE